jgi:hypothetical protein
MVFSVGIAITGPDSLGKWLKSAFWLADAALNELLGGAAKEPLQLPDKARIDQQLPRLDEGVLVFYLDRTLSDHHGVKS